VPVVARLPPVSCWLCIRWSETTCKESASVISSLVGSRLSTSMYSANVISNLARMLSWLNRTTDTETVSESLNCDRHYLLAAESEPMRPCVGKEAMTLNFPFLLSEVQLIDSRTGVCQWLWRIRCPVTAGVSDYVIMSRAIRYHTVNCCVAIAYLMPNEDTHWRDFRIQSRFEWAVNCSSCSEDEGWGWWLYRGK